MDWGWGGGEVAERGCVSRSVRARLGGAGDRRCQSTGSAEVRMRAAPEPDQAKFPRRPPLWLTVMTSAMTES